MESKMGILNFFKKDQDKREHVPVLEPFVPQELAQAVQAEELPVHRSVDEATPVVGLATIYQFLQADFESRGYHDALVNPDDSYKTDNFRLIRCDLQILLHQVGTYHDDLLRELDFHIQSRARAGLIDLVDALKNRKEMVHEHVKKTMAIQNELDQEQGMTQRILLSYQRGFMKGLSAISHAAILNKQF